MMFKFEEIYVYIINIFIRYLEVVVQDGYEVRVSFIMGQFFFGQFKYLSCIFCVYMYLFRMEKKFKLNI